MAKASSEGMGTKPLLLGFVPQPNLQQENGMAKVLFVKNESINVAFNTVDSRYFGCAFNQFIKKV